MNLQKRECTIEIRVLPRGAGWTDIEWFVPSFMSEPLLLIASDVSNLFGDFVSSLYHLHPNRPQSGRGFSLIEHKYFEYDLGTGELGKMYSEDELKPSGPYVTIPYKAGFHWFEEPGGSHWILTREPTENTDFTVDLDLVLDRRRNDGDIHIEYSYKFEYWDLCYAVAKAMTDVIKEFGIFGYYHSTGDEISLYQLLFIKSIALDCIEASKLENREKYCWATDFDKEMELLLFRM